MKRMSLILITVIITADLYCTLTTIHKFNNKYMHVETGTARVLSPLR